MDTAALLLHPVRLRIVQAMLGGRELTTADLVAQLPEVSPATVYRQVSTLADAGILLVVDEQRVRGAVQRTYALDVAAAQVSAQDIAALTPEQHRQGFTAFVAGLLAQLDAYLASSTSDPATDQLGYRTVALWVTDEEMAALAAEMSAPVLRLLDRGPGEGRTRRLLSTVLMPDRTTSPPPGGPGPHRAP
ncbi:helix-turn-helix domain-containing protein [Isoptericola sp. b490]|uniref:helix-turn-helix domain-containing protein n=1 Tax=Actinotalea lenta TaxID=3064654 RepID=UPI002712923C|nr:helix-turn-helix domain-containing protein [Isoptericola sp. b490]MDO8121937.1 helix-turn-helix domain-containing protein [Isoptericola sp. b490]